MLGIYISRCMEPKYGHSFLHENKCVTITANMRKPLRYERHTISVIATCNRYSNTISLKRSSHSCFYLTHADTSHCCRLQKNDCHMAQIEYHYLDAAHIKMYTNKLDKIHAPYLITNTVTSKCDSNGWHTIDD